MQLKKVIALFLCLLLCMQVLTGSVFATDPNIKTISGDGVKVTFDMSNGTLTLYRLDGEQAHQMSNASTMGYPIVNGQNVQDFTGFTCAVVQNTEGHLGAGDQMIITSTSPSTGLVRSYLIETSDTVAGALYTETSYRATTVAVTPTWFVDSSFELSDHTNIIWSYNGGGEGPMHYYDTLQKIDLSDSTTFSRENKQDYTAASIPVADIYSANGGITVGDASATRREVHTPVQETAQSASVSIKWPGKELALNVDTSAGQSFVVVHSGDYFVGLRGYKNAMEHLGMVMPTEISDRSYELRWESWGWAFNWTVDLIIGKLDELQAEGIKQITVDDGWYDSPGSWGLSSSKFPNGAADARRLTDAIHAHGMSAILWWRPNDGGRNDCLLYQEHPEYYVKNSNGTTAKLGAPGSTDNSQWFSTIGYALCPKSEGAIASQTAFINRAMNDWGFDGFKADYVWSMPRCYDTSHGHAYPEESTEMQSEFYRTAYEAMCANDPDVFNLLCNCGTPQDYYSLQYMTQIATADPTSVDQTRRRAKAYKALMGDYFPVTTDHNELWYPSAVGTGSVLIEKRALAGINLTEYERWLDIANDVQLHKGRFIGDLYSYGFDPYETYVVEKDGVMYYAFFRDGAKYQPDGYPDIELRGLDAEKLYRIVDYTTGRVVATNLQGDNAVFNNRFSSHLLVKAIELEVPDETLVDPNEGFISVDATDSRLVYSGTWYDDPNTAFDEGTAKYTTSAGASVELTFKGTTIRWYGQNDTNFGRAKVYLDDELVETVYLNNTPAAQLLLFEAFDLTPEEHVIRVVCDIPVIDVDRFTYEPLPPEIIYTMVDDTSNRIIYTGEWTIENNDAFYGGSSRYTSDSIGSAELSFEGTAVRWYGRTGSAFRTADVYIDGALVENIVVYGEEASNVILFELTGLSEGTHTIKVSTSYGAFDLDAFAYGDLEDTDTPEEFAVIDAMDERLEYSGTWVNDLNESFQNGTARYTAQSGASVTLTFEGSAIRWHGQNDVNFGTARIYIDEIYIETVNVNGELTVNKLLFEKTDLENGEHTIRVVCDTPVIDVDYFSYK